MKKPIILCVDDEKIVLDSLKRELSVSFKEMLTIEFAESGLEALEFLNDSITNQNEIPIVISDWLMPGIKGDEFLIEVHKILPATRKIMLTGQATTDGIGNAVNKAKLYRYIPKPWQIEDMALTVTEAFKSFYKDKQLEIQQQKLIDLNSSLEFKVRQRTKELEEKNIELQKSRDEIGNLLSKTLKGSVNILIKILSKAQPNIFEKGYRMRKYVKRIIKTLNIQNGWELEMACLLSQIGIYELPEYIRSKIINGEPISQRERSYFQIHTRKAEELLTGIPYLHNIAKSIGKHLDENTFGNDFADILRTVSDFDDKLMSGKSENTALGEMKRSTIQYVDKFLDALIVEEDEYDDNLSEKSINDENGETKIISLSELKIGDIIGESIYNEAGMVLIPAGKEVSEEIIGRIANLFEKNNMINQITIIKDEALIR